MIKKTKACRSATYPQPGANWILKCIEAGKKAGIEAPATEAKIMTNFIR